jgi:hypothetical protein
LSNIAINNRLLPVGVDNSWCHSLSIASRWFSHWFSAVRPSF